MRRPEGLLYETSNSSDNWGTEQDERQGDIIDEIRGAIVQVNNSKTSVVAEIIKSNIMHRA